MVARHRKPRWRLHIRGRVTDYRGRTDLYHRKKERTMPAEKFFADSPAEVGLNRDKVQALMDRAERDVKDGVLPACQVAVARSGKIAAMQTFGRAVQGGTEKPATDETVFVAMSATKAI